MSKVEVLDEVLEIIIKKILQDEESKKPEENERVKI